MISKSYIPDRSSIGHGPGPSLISFDNGSVNNNTNVNASRKQSNM
jgi:hypothetical protein